jgi:transcription elongation factor Elf1
MGKILDFTSRKAQKEDIVFMCPGCGAQRFWINDNGTLTCTACKLEQAADEEWLEKANTIRSNGNTVPD